MLSESNTDTLPSGVSFNAATGALGGTPAVGAVGTYTLHFTAHNGVGSDATQTFTLTVGQAPAITSANNTTFVVGAVSSFTIVPSGFPAPTLSESNTDTLPAGVSFNPATGVLSGTPTGSAGTYTLHFTASNGASPNATQTFTLTTVVPGLQGKTLTVLGTPAADTASLVFTDASDIKVTVNGTSHSYSLSQVNTINFNGDGGADTLSISGLPGVASAALSPLTAKVTGSGYTFNITNTQKIYITGASGDTATFADSPGDDLFEGLSTESFMENVAATNSTTFYNQVNGFSAVSATATTGNDEAVFSDSAGNDTYTANASGNKMVGSSYQVSASGFKLAYGYLTAGGTDTANLYPSATTANYVTGTASGTVNFFDSSGADSFSGLPTYSQMTNGPAIRWSTRTRPAGSVT